MKIITNILVCLSIALTTSVFNTSFVFAQSEDKTTTEQTTKQDEPIEGSDLTEKPFVPDRSNQN